MKTYTLVTLFAAAALSCIVGCDRQIDKFATSPPDSGPVPSNVSAQPTDGAVVLSWEIADSAQVDRYRIYTARDGADGPYTLRDSTENQSITLTGLQVNQRYYFRVAAVKASGFEFSPSEPVTARILYLSIAINNGSEYTSNRNVQVVVNAPTGITTHTMLSEEPLLAGSQFLPVSGISSPFTLSEGDGMKIVYARLQFDDGTSTAQVLRDSITLDTEVEVDSVFFGEPVGRTYFTTGEQILFGLDAGESGGSASVSFSGGGSVPLYDDGTRGDNIADDGIYRGRWTVPVTFVLTGGAVTGSFTDRAGNRVLNQMALRLLTVFTPPLAVTASASATSDSTVAIAWTRSQSSIFAAYRVYRGANMSVDHESTLVANIETQGTTAVVDTGVVSGSTYYYRVYVYDQSGLFTPSSPTESVDVP